MSGKRQDLIEQFRALDRRLSAQGVSPQTLAPERDAATSFALIGEYVASHLDDTDPAREIARQLGRILDAQLESFPENIFSDFDYLAASLVRQARDGGPDAAAEIRRTGGRIARLQEMFGRHSPIRFRYVHDFIYGYDWAKWVAKDPARRAAVMPYAPPFLDYMIVRGKELYELIARDDRKYPALRNSDYRNPFGFSREPQDEAALLRRLAREGQIPVAAWRFDAAPDWEAPYYDLRRQAAEALGIPGKENDR